MWSIKNEFAIILIVLATTSIEIHANELSEGELKFSSRLYEEEAKLSGQSFLLSPFSAFNALAVLSQGAEGATLHELVNGLHINSNKAVVANQFQKYYKQLQSNAGETKFNVANRIYTQQSYQLNATFQAVATQKFGSGIQPLNFSNSQASANTINAFVEQQTDGKIQDLISVNSLNADTRVVIVNAIYMKGLWMHKFDKKNTKSGQFSSFEYANYMNQVNRFNYTALPELNATALEMRYANSSFSVVFILPNANVAYGDVENKLQTYDWMKITNQMRVQEVNVTIPKVTMSYQQNLNYVLSKVGINQIFESNANLNGILAQPESLEVSQVVQKCFVELDEDGATAAAATGIIAVPLAIPMNPPKPIVFNVNRPFIYLIRDTVENTILFYGRFASTRV